MEGFSFSWIHDDETGSGEPLQSLLVGVPDCQGIFLGSARHGRLVSYFTSATAELTTEADAQAWLIAQAAPVLQRLAQFLAPAPVPAVVREASVTELHPHERLWASGLGSWDANGSEVA